MEKKISKANEKRRSERLEKAKKHKLILAFATLPPFISTVTFTVLYALKIRPIWLPILTSALWLALGALFVYATKSRWGYVTKKGAESEETTSAVTLYNIILTFVLCVLFIVFTVIMIKR